MGCLRRVAYMDHSLPRWRYSANVWSSSIVHSSVVLSLQRAGGLYQLSQSVEVFRWGARAEAEKRVGVCELCFVKEMLPGHLGREGGSSAT